MKFTKLYSRFPKRFLLFAAAFLLILSYVLSVYFFTKPSIRAEQKNLQQYIHQQQKDFKRLIQDSALMRKLVQQNESLEEFRKLDEKPYGIFLFAETLGSIPQFLFWNDHKLLPPYADFSKPDGEYASWEQNGYYVIEKRTIRLSDISSNVIAYALVPVMSQYNSRSSYLSDQFIHNSEAHHKITIDSNQTAYPIESYHNQTLFYINKKGSDVPVHSTLAIVIQLAAIVLLLAYLQFIAEVIIRKKGTVIGLAFLFIVLVVFRLIVFYFPAGFYFFQTSIFETQISGASHINKSLGDLLINALLFCWFAVFAWFGTGPHKRLPFFLKNFRLFIAGVIALFVLIWTTFVLADVVKAMVSNSDISFNVNDFFSLDDKTVIGFVVLALLSLGFYYFSRLLFRIIFPAFPQPVYVYFLLPLAGLLYLSVQPNNTEVLFHIPVLGWLIVYSLLLSREHLVINKFRINIAGVLFWIIIFSASLSLIILNENQRKEWNARKLFAADLDNDTGPNVEKELNIGIRYINTRFLFNNFNRLSDSLQQKSLRDSIIKSNLSPSYFKNFTVRFYLFDSTGKGLFNRDSASFFELNAIYTNRSVPTSSPDIVLHEKKYGEFDYITKRVIGDSVGTKGFLFIVSTPKRFKREGIAYEILGNVEQKAIETTRQYSYAIYKGENLSEANSEIFSFPIRLDSVDIKNGEYKREAKDEYSILWFNAGPDSTNANREASPDKTIMVVKKEDVLIESITLFSYLFCSFLFMIGLIKVIAIILKSGNNWRVLQSFWQLNIRSQIQGTVIFVSVLSFIIIGIVTISFFIDRSDRNNQEQLLRISGLMVDEVEQNLPLQSDSVFYSMDTDSAYIYKLQNIIDRIATLQNVDVNVYDIYGNLYVTSSPDIYSYGVLSTKMHPLAYYHLNRLQEVQYLQKENMSTLTYSSIYNAIRDQNGQIRSYLNIPYYISETELQQEISNFLVAIINLNAFVFLIAGTIAVIITNKITRSFSVIGDKMKAITLGGTNEEIEWKRDDEIGELVTQYNKMVWQLEQSAEALAKSEREGAWREMARQVAHEIKNPLTPMKLSIQYLQKSITNGSSNVKELTTNVASTLIEQIDHLSKIAADFGRFANIGNRNLEVFDLHTVIESLKDLYSSNTSVQLRWHKIHNEIMVEADRTHMNRLFTNLLTNAIDACSNQALCRISIIEEMKEGAVLIHIMDDGEGIPVEMQPKIFTPNFTTKTSGTGLGLAICKSIVEQAGGDIWFKTEQGIGTTFFVKLPLVDSF